MLIGTLCCFLPSNITFDCLRSSSQQQLQHLRSLLFTVEASAPFYHLCWVNYTHLLLILRYLRWFLLPNSRRRIIYCDNLCMCFLVFLLYWVWEISQNLFFYLILSLRIFQNLIFYYYWVWEFKISFSTGWVWQSSKTSLIEFGDLQNLHFY